MMHKTSFNIQSLNVDRDRTSPALTWHEENQHQLLMAFSL